MASVWDYEGTRVIVSGGGGSGMGAAAVTELARLGAEVHVIDLREPPPGATGYFKTDLLDPDAVAQTVDAIGGEIDALFNCAGRPGIKFPDLEVMTVNFLVRPAPGRPGGAPHAEGGAIVTISSGAGAGWMSNLAKWMPLVTSDGFDAGLDWLKEHPDEIEGGYAPSKEAIIVWTLWACDRPGGEGDPGQLHQSRPDADADDARVRGDGGQGVHGALPHSRRPPLQPPRSRPTPSSSSTAAPPPSSPVRT